MDSQLIAFAEEWLNLALRLFHVLMAIAWIGSSLFFMWLDAEARHAGSKQPGVEGEVWMVHGGGFYWVQKFNVAPAFLPKQLHWFRWEAALTFLSGFSLLCLIFFTQASTYLIDPAVRDLAPWQAVAIALASMAAWWFAYDFLWMSRLAREREGWATLISLAGLIAMVLIYAQVFSGRGSYLMTGATLGTIMVANVWVRILPGQNRIIAALLAGAKPDPVPGKRGKQRSVHNNYVTLPVLFVMLSGHYPGTFGHPQHWLVLLLIFAVAVAVNHWLNQAHVGKAEPLTLVGAAVLAIPLLVIAAQPRFAEDAAAGPKVEFARVHVVIAERCATCHSARPSDDVYARAPTDMRLDSPDEIRRHAAKINTRAVITRSMPPANKTAMTADERRMLGAWIAQGAKLD